MQLHSIVNYRAQRQKALLICRGNSLLLLELDDFFLNIGQLDVTSDTILNNSNGTSNDFINFLNSNGLIGGNLDFPIDLLQRYLVQFVNDFDRFFDRNKDVCHGLIRATVVVRNNAEHIIPKSCEEPRLSYIGRVILLQIFHK